MTKKDLQEIFESSFDWENWRKVIDFVFPEFQFLANPHIKNITTQIGKYNIEEIRIRGNTTLCDNIHLTLAEVALKDSVNLPRNVKGIRKSITDEVIANTQVTIAVFYSPDKMKWRFTLAVKKLTEDFNEVDYKPHSFTYVFGESEKGRTAADRFYKLASIEKKKLPDLEEAFSVTSLSKKFFEQYKSVYLQFVEEIVGHPSKLALFKVEDKEKSARDFVKKMMGRIVFLYFLQKKGWMGCKTKWQEGDEHFMKRLFGSATMDETFYSQYLAPLFFEILNKKREEQDEDCIINGRNYGKVPFLNGGLFEREILHPDDLRFSWELFNEFFQILDSYNFTIIEDDPDYKEVAVDPEMLGHIFENLLEDNKDKGAFYTPKEIVQYMCRESLIEYLFTKLSENISNVHLKDFIRKFIEDQAFADLNNLDQNVDRYVLEALRDVKICDPAIGSGAFPMGILLEMYRMLEQFEYSDVFRSTWDMVEWNAATIKERIVQNSIYGVDIEKGAVDIARLRFWLSIIIDEEQPKPLPNLDYKIMQGNSLLESFGPIDLKFDKDKYNKPIQKQKNIFGEVIDPQISIAEAMAARGFDITTLEEEFFDTDDLLRKEEIRNQITEFEKSFIGEQINERKDKVIKNIFTLTEKLKDSRNYNNIKTRNDDIKLLRKAEIEFEEIEKIEKESKDIKEGNKPYFLWNLYFMDVMKIEGFNIVIGNPPYIRVEAINHDHVDIFKRTFSSATGKFDLSSLFIEKSVNLLSNHSILCFISTYQFLYSSSGIGLRKFLIEEASIKMDLFSSSDQQFTNAVTYTGIFTIKNSNPGMVKYSFIENKGLRTKKQYFIISSENFASSKVVLGNTSIYDKILKENNYILGKEIGWAKCGVVTSADDIFFLDQETIKKEKIEEDLLYPILGTKNLTRWNLIKPNKFVLYPYFQLNKKTKLINERNLRHKYPNTWNYLQKNMDKLKSRSQGRKNYEDSIEWYKLNRPREKWIYDSIKIIYPGTTNQSKFALDENGEVFRNARLYAFVLKNSDISLYKYLTCILNSSLCSYLISLKCPPKNNGYFELSTNFIESFPFIITEEYIDKLIELYDRIQEALKNKKDIGLLEKQVNILVCELYSVETTL